MVQKLGDVARPVGTPVIRTKAGQDSGGTKPAADSGSNSRLKDWFAEKGQALAKNIAAAVLIPVVPLAAAVEIYESILADHSSSQHATVPGSEGYLAIGITSASDMRKLAAAGITLAIAKEYVDHVVREPEDMIQLYRAGMSGKIFISTTTGHSSIKDVIAQSKRLGFTADDLRAWDATGIMERQFRPLALLAALRDVGLTPAGVTEYLKAGVAPSEGELIVEARRDGITPQRVADYVAAGIDKSEPLKAVLVLDPEVSPALLAEYRKALDDAGFKFDVEHYRIMDFHEAKLTPKLVAGYGEADVPGRSILMLHTSGVTPELAKGYSQDGVKNPWGMAELYAKGILPGNPLIPGLVAKWPEKYGPLSE